MCTRWLVHGDIDNGERASYNAAGNIDLQEAICNLKLEIECKVERTNT